MLPQVRFKILLEEMDETRAAFGMVDPNNLRSPELVVGLALSKCLQGAGISMPQEAMRRITDGLPDLGPQYRALEYLHGAALAVLSDVDPMPFVSAFQSSLVEASDVANEDLFQTASQFAAAAAARAWLGDVAGSEAFLDLALKKPPKRNNAAVVAEALHLLADPLPRGWTFTRLSAFLAAHGMNGFDGSCLILAADAAARRVGERARPTIDSGATRLDEDYFAGQGDEAVECQTSGAMPEWVFRQKDGELAWRQSVSCSAATIQEYAPIFEDLTLGWAVHLYGLLVGEVQLKSVRGLRSKKQLRGFMADPDAQLVVELSLDHPVEFPSEAFGQISARLGTVVRWCSTAARSACPNVQLRVEP